MRKQKQSRPIHNLQLTIPQSVSWWRAMIVGVGAYLLAQVVVALLFSGLSHVLGGEPAFARLFDRGNISADFINYALSTLLMLGIISKYLKRHGSRLRRLDFKPFKVWRAAGLLILSIITLVLATEVIFTILSTLVPSLDLNQTQNITFTKATSAPDVALAVVALVAVAPIAEETLFRGFMLPAVARRFGWLAASVITALLFALLHFQLNVGIVTFIMGLLLAWLYKKTDSLWPGILFHSLKNAVAVLIIFS